MLTCNRTTEAPDLPPTHPLRSAFARYGKWAARHVKTVLPICTAVIFLFLYLFPFLYTTDATNITSGVSNLPHHVWTDAQPLNDPLVEPDVIMRSIWIHGSYMKALNRDVLLGALELQDELLGPTTNFNPRRPGDNIQPSDVSDDLTPEERDSFHIVNGLTDNSWFFHSPLQYWSGSADNIRADQDIVSTVNAKKTQSTSVNVTLRHSIVFSGKRFEERRLVAADALVITLIHRRDSPVGRKWVKKAEALASQPNTKWQIIPPDGKSLSNQLYEFQFRPMSWSDWLVLSIAYTVTICYLLLSLSKLRAVKSRLGLIITILVQITASVVSSFTVCAIFKIDLSRIPYYAYPLVVLAISMENSFRLINAVILTSSSISNSDRIGEAFGKTAHIAVANRVQNLVVLLGLSRITYPGVAAFCTFAAIATIFDFFFLATFFLSVLNVDVRQRELIELEKASHKRARPADALHSRHAWFDFRQFRLGETTTSTRVAGTVVLLGFVLIAQSHYAPEGRRQWLNQIFSFSWNQFAQDSPKSSLLIEINQARSPTSWLRLQDHETAREVIKVVKPQAHSYVARVFDPLIFVLRGSDRVPQSREPLFLPAIYDFINHEVPIFIVLSLIVVAAIRLFTDFLLRDQFQETLDSDHPDDEPLLSVRPLTKGHTLDVAMMAASPGGHLVSVGLDRAIQVWDVRCGTKNQVLSDPEVPLENPFPVLSMAVDDESKWLALVSWQRVFLWSIEERQWAATRDIDLGGQKPQAVFFNSKPQESTPTLVLIKRNGTGIEMQLEVEESRVFNICKTPLVWAVSFTEKCYPHQQNHPPLSILTVSRKSCIHLVSQQDNEWVSKEVKLSDEREAARDPIHCVLPIPALSAYLIGRSRSVDLVDLDTSAVIHTFSTETMRLKTLKQVCLTRAQPSSLSSITLAYVSADTGDLIIQTYLPEEGENILYCPRGHRPWGPARESRKRIENPGKWEVLVGGSIVGVRQRKSLLPPPSPISTNGGGGAGGLRRRSRADSRASDDCNRRKQVWEAWVINHPELEAASEGGRGGSGGSGHLGGRSSSGRYSEVDETRPLDPAGDNLMISELGPMVKLGMMSVAVGFGNVVKVISAGHEYFDKIFLPAANGFQGMGADPPLLAERRRRNKAGGGGGHGRANGLGLGLVGLGVVSPVGGGGGVFLRDGIS
ncbi:sterol regulatory element-binding protein cleavage-activating protein [Podospora fimiseda]|uniref:Sterol regulatory element-binding protein cleavage-activating protein n=1 Tax=Podospora fimiseda TaxID=252190 RepID=A0AAN7BP07_9PEZI|nr:sterol regulatory element-binding protein cleavage-activating protein [Podospora fimiseda]